VHTSTLELLNWAFAKASVSMKVYEVIKKLASSEIMHSSS